MSLIGNVLEERNKLSNEMETLQKEHNKKHKELDNQVEKLQKEFETKVKKEFKGVSVKVIPTVYSFRVTALGNDLIDHQYNSSKFNNINKKLYLKLIALHKEYYGEIKEEVYIPYSTTTCGSTLLDALNDVTYNYYNG